MLKDLIHQPESKTLEFKRDLSSPRPVLKTLVAFANSAGGRLVLGVDDDRQIIGVADPLDEEERLANLIADSISPRLVPNIEMATVDGKTLLVVEVFLSGTRPHFLKSGGMESGVFVRLGSTNRQADAHLVAELQRGVAGVSFDAFPMPGLTQDALDLKAIAKDFEGRKPADERTLQSLRILVRDQGRLVPSQGGMLLYGTDRRQYFDDAWIQCGRFIGKDKADIFDHIEDIKLGVSQIRNPVIARVFRELDLIEQWGSGIPGIFRQAKAEKLPEPVIEELAGRVRFTVPLAEILPLTREQSRKGGIHPTKAQSGAGSGLESGLESRLESLADRILVSLTESPLSKAELARALGHASISSKLNLRVNQLLDLDFIERTIPEKPNSRLQKYRLTENSRAFLHGFPIAPLIVSP
ncbi:MAG: RNA-binding domain-containing protein [Akkermansiaceae bacterium]